MANMLNDCEISPTNYMVAFLRQRGWQMPEITMRIPNVIPEVDPMAQKVSTHPSTVRDPYHDCSKCSMLSKLCEWQVERGKYTACMPLVRQTTMMSKNASGSLCSVCQSPVGLSQHFAEFQAAAQ